MARDAVDDYEGHLVVGIRHVPFLSSAILIMTKSSSIALYQPTEWLTLYRRWNMTDEFVHMLNEARGTLDVEGVSGVWAFQYAECISRANVLSELIKDYCFQDVCMAVFCVNSWHENRSAQECVLGLNASLMITKVFGTKTIESYGDFEQFFRSIYEACKTSEYEDYVLPIMGQSKIEFEGCWYPVILGCGMVQEYPRLYFGEALCIADDARDEYRGLLTYVAQMCREIGYGGWSDSTHEEVRFVLPPEEHWQRTRRWFMSDPVSILTPYVIEELSASILPVEMRHFVSNTNYLLPLFNPSILSDYLLQRIHSIGKKKASAVVESVIATEAIKIYGAGIGRQEGCIAFPVFRYNGAYLEDCPSTLILFDMNGTVTLFYNLAHGDGNLEQLICHLKADNKALEVIDTGWQGRKPVVYGMRPSAIRRVTLVAFVDDVEPALHSRVQPVSGLADITCGALDLLTLLQAASSVEEISAFFAEVASSKHKLIRLLSGIAPFFLCWKDNNRSILSGAKKRESMSIYCDFNDTDRYYRDFFCEIEGRYPFTDNSYTLGSPFCNTYEECERGFVTMRSKADGQFLGVAKGLGDGCNSFVHIFVAHDRSFFVGDEGIEEEGSAYALYEDLLKCMVNSLESGFSRLADALGGVFQIGYVAKVEADARGFECIDCEYGVYGLSVEGEPHVVLFSVDASVFVPALMDATDRSVECRLVGDILSLLPEDKEGVRCELIHSVRELAGSGKMVDMRGIELPYTWNGVQRVAEETDVSRAYAIRAVATSAAKVGVSPGMYYGRDANGVLRSFQEELTAEFKHELSKYSPKALLTGLYAALARAMHDYYIHSMRFGSFDRVEGTESQRVDSKTLDLREAARRWIRASRYCIETTLCLDTYGGEIPGTSDLSALVSLADQLVSLCDEADILLFAPPGFGIEIDDDYIVTAVEDDSKVAISKKLRRRQLLDPGHSGGVATKDTDYVSKAANAFRKDTGISFECFLDVLDTLALGFDEDVEGVTLRSNVVRINSSDLESFLNSELEVAYSAQELASCVRYITLDPAELQVISGKQLDYLPFGRVKDRPNRLELKPIVRLGDELFFAPVALGMLRRRWIGGIAERFLPVKASFNSLYGVISQWKRHYEKSLESDTYQSFIDAGYSKGYVYKGIELKKRGRHPEFLGDYDVLAFNQETKTIWAIECKEFEKIESAYDYMQLQDRWFGKKGLLSKFERRINYLKSNAGQVANDLGFVYEGALEVRALLVCNKLFDNMLGTSSFEVVTQNELKSLI